MPQQLSEMILIRGCIIFNNDFACGCVCAYVYVCLLKKYLMNKWMDDYGKHKNNYNAVSLTGIKLKFGVLIGKPVLQHNLSTSHLILV